MIRKMIRKVITILIGIAIVSCTEEYSFDIDTNNQILVVDAVLTDTEGLNYVQLTKSKNGINDSVYYSETGIASNFEIIDDAYIRLLDDAGNIEVLKFVEENDPMNRMAYYKINTIGKVGRTYTLEITWKNKLYVSSSVLKAAPKINQVAFRNKYLEAKNEWVTVPTLFFDEPQESIDYYLLHYTVNGYAGNSRSWSYSIISDEYLSEHVNGMEIDDGQSGSGRDFYEEIYEGTVVEVYLQSITAEIYAFYKTIINQFESDGGAFSPVPATPHGNISNGALGVFRCSSVSKKSIVKD